MTSTLIITSFFALLMGLGALGLAYWLKGVMKQKQLEDTSSKELNEVFDSQSQS
ncbi:hypothetical protein P8629_09260 [Hydrogenovibrio sp. 3SP14C1]|uniref:hypothetical protein n=1 Tax=Hydrogenovibrio sp. 3SP14C1 TaxID=3038774 RepID=UPI0024176985|nr:hypothetical protein [Hydrogenovibrio sp. 3SP14C1]MDG4813191.1 hypothetical protein [Hydrogenovibrio sp. 3SP14C1]